MPIHILVLFNYIGIVTMCEEPRLKMSRFLTERIKCEFHLKKKKNLF